MSFDQISRAVLIRQIYDKMSEDEKRAFIMSHLDRGDSNDAIMKLLLRQNSQISDIQQHVDENHWLSDFGANIAGNAAYGAATWLLAGLIKLIR